MNIFNRTVKNILLKEAPLTMRSFDRETPFQSQNQNINFTPYKKSARKPNIGIGNEMRGTISGQGTETTPIKPALTDRLGYPSTETVLEIIGYISIIDPTPITSIPDIVRYGYLMVAEPSKDNAISFLLTILFALPYLNVVKKIKMLKKAGKVNDAANTLNKEILDNKSDIILQASKLDPKLGEFTKNSFNILERDK